jgi:hypothetical protein
MENLETDAQQNPNNRVFVAGIDTFVCDLCATIDFYVPCNCEELTRAFWQEKVDKKKKEKVMAAMKNMIDPASVPEQVTFTVTTNVDDQALHDLFVNGCESGIDYWCHFESYHWMRMNEAGEYPKMGNTDLADLTGFRAVIWVEGLSDEVDEEKFVIDRSVILKGVIDCATRTDLEYLNSRTPMVARAILVGDPDWYEHDDAVTSDQIIQVGLFGKVIFG